MTTLAVWNPAAPTIVIAEPNHDITSGKREDVNNTGWTVLDERTYRLLGRIFKRKVYDRLRKRSYRKWNRLLGFFFSEARVRLSLKAVANMQHKAYVQGVRDALKAMPDG